MHKSIGGKREGKKGCKHCTIAVKNIESNKQKPK
jgi:hypothetical protein